MSYGVGTDTGGTFTDLVTLDDIGDVTRAIAPTKTGIFDDMPSHSAIVDIDSAVWEQA